jgi:transposase
MAQKRKETSFDIRQLVVFRNAKGQSERKISKDFQIPRSTVGLIIRRFKNQDRLENKPRTGRNPLLNKYEKRWIMRKVKKDPKISAPKLATELFIHCGKNVNPETIRKTIRENGNNGRIARKKPFISETNRQKRLKFAEEHKDRPETYWNKTIFADESKFNIFGPDGRTRVWRKPNTEHNKENTISTVKNDGGSVMVWGCFSAAGVGKLIFINGVMDRFKYIDILKDGLLPSAAEMGPNGNFQFHQDNDPKHTVHDVRLWLLYNCPKVTKTPPQSPDLNPIENLWDELDKRVRQHSITNQQQFKKIVASELKKISVDYCKKLVESMPKRL